MSGESYLFSSSLHTMYLLFVFVFFFFLSGNGVRMPTTVSIQTSGPSFLTLAFSINNRGKRSSSSKTYNKYGKGPRDETTVSLLAFLLLPRLLSRHRPLPFQDHQSPRRQTRNRPCPRPSVRKLFPRQLQHRLILPRDDDGAD
jgi:hypothetical protein